MPPKRMGHRVPVSKDLGGGLYGLPNSTRVRDVNLPDHLQQGKIVTRDDLEDIQGLDRETALRLIAQARADVLAEVNHLLSTVGRAAYVFQMPVPSASVVVEHNLGREAVAVSVFSLDYLVQYEFFEQTPIDPNRTQLAFDEPISFVALVN